MINPFKYRVVKVKTIKVSDMVTKTEGKLFIILLENFFRIRKFEANGFSLVHDSPIETAKRTSYYNKTVVHWLAGGDLE